jgi:hypothetical protein
MSEDWKTAYPVGCRVELDVQAWAAWLGMRRALVHPPYTGTVVGYSDSARQEIRVHLDGRTSRHGKRCPVACLRRLAEPEAGA